MTRSLVGRGYGGTCSLSLGRRVIRRRRVLVQVGPRVTVQRPRSGVDYRSYHSHDAHVLRSTYGGDRARDPCPTVGAVIKVRQSRLPSMGQKPGFTHTSPWRMVRGIPNTNQGASVTDVYSHIRTIFAQVHAGSHLRICEKAGSR